MNQSAYYPLFLDLSQSACLVVGGGEVGRRKLASLLDCGVRAVLVLDTAPPDDMLAALLARPGVTFRQRGFDDADLDGRALVFAATGDTAVNARIAAACRARGILCNRVDAPRDGSCIVPASARAGALTAALSTGGASPALARLWKGELEAWLRPRAGMAALMGRLRPLVLALHQDTGQNTRLFRSIAHSSLQDALLQGDRRACEDILSQLLPPPLRGRIPELLHELF